MCLIVDDHLTNHREKKQNTNRLSHNGDIKENAWVRLGNAENGLGKVNNGLGNVQKMAEDMFFWFLTDVKILLRFVSGLRTPGKNK